MNYVSRLRRRSTRRGLVAVVAAALLAPLAAADPAGAGPVIGGAASHLAAAADTPIQDRSTEMPRTRHNEITGDFLRRGYDQRAAVEGPSDGQLNLNIYDSDLRGGALLRSTPTDLRENDNPSLFVDPLRDTAVANGLNTIPLAWTPDGFWMAGRRNSDGLNYLYRLPPDGSCAQTACMDETQGFGASGWISGHVADQPDRPMAPSAIAVGPIEGDSGLGGPTTLIAVGMTNSLPGDRAGADGVMVFEWAPGFRLGDVSENFLPVATEGGANQTVVTGLDWDDRGSGMLAIATTQDPEGSSVRMEVARLAYENEFLQLSGQTYYTGMQPPRTALSAAVGHRVDGSQVVAFGMDDGSVNLWDPAVTSGSLLSRFTGSASSPVDALTFTDRIDGTVGVPDLVAVSSRGNSAQVLRYSGATTLAPLPVTAGGGTTTSVGEIRGWFPGYKTGQVSFSNDTASDSTIQLDFATRPNASYGCWFAKKFQNGGLPLPTAPVFLDQGAGPSVFSIATLTAGDSGGCAAADFTGQWAAYVRITPVGRPADGTVAKLVWSRSGDLDVQSVGGSLDVVAQQNTNSGKPLGEWNISIQSPPAPGVPTSIKVTGTRLDPAGTDQPVYRIDVPATTWSLPLATPPRLQTVLSPMEVHGITTDGDDVSLGLLAPQGQPSRVTSGSVSLSPVSFYWQNPSPIDGSTITDVYVQAGSSNSNRINLAGLPTPAAGTTVGEVVVCPGSGSTSCDATADPVANGLDQAKLRIQLHDGNGAILPVSDPVYSRVYYRDENDDLLTGLIPEDGSAYIRVSPYAGAYPNDGTTATPVRPPTNGLIGGRYGYLSTTNTAEQEITAHVGGSDMASDPTIVDAVDFTPTVQAGAQAAQGFYVSGCRDYSGNTNCRLAAITTTRPGLFLTTDDDTGDVLIGLQFTTAGSAGPSQASVQAQTSLTSLPLQQVANQPEHTVAAGPLNISNGELSLATTSGFQPADAIDTFVVSHGTQIPIRNVRVGGGN